MHHKLLAGLLFLTSPSVIFPADNAAATQLIRQLPALAEVSNWDQQLSALNAKPMAMMDKKPLVDPLYKKLQDAEKLYQALAEMIKVGDSVFDYPGLLAAARVYYSAGTDSYELYFGSQNGVSGKALMTDSGIYIIAFDRTGRITGKRSLEVEL